MEVLIGGVKMIKNEKGVTLIELLAALSILSIILLLAGSIHLFGQKQSLNQTKDIQSQSNVRLALNVITKEIRKATSVTVTVDPITKLNVLNLNDNNDVYKFENYTIKKNGQILFENIQTFTPTMSGDKIMITIANQPTNNIPQTSLSATIYLRN